MVPAATRTAPPPARRATWRAPGRSTGCATSWPPSTRTRGTSSSAPARCPANSGTSPLQEGDGHETLRKDGTRAPPPLGISRHGDRAPFGPVEDRRYRRPLVSRERSSVRREVRARDRRATPRRVPIVSVFLGIVVRLFHDDHPAATHARRVRRVRRSHRDCDGSAARWAAASARQAPRRGVASGAAKRPGSSLARSASGQGAPPRSATRMRRDNHEVGASREAHHRP